MSRLYGRTFDLYNISCILKDAKINKYHHDNRIISWNEVKGVCSFVAPLLSDETKRVLHNQKIVASSHVNLFDKTIKTEIPVYGDSEAEIVFPTRRAKSEYKREFVYFLGMILANYNADSCDSDNYGVPDEYDDVIPLLIDYLYTDDRDFSLKYLNDLQFTLNQYVDVYKKHQKIEELEHAINYLTMKEKRREAVDKMIKEEHQEIELNTSLCLAKASSIEGALKLIDNAKDKDELKSIIEELTFNKDDSRAKIMVEHHADSYGFKALRKEIDKFRIK